MSRSAASFRSAEKAAAAALQQEQTSRRAEVYAVWLAGRNGFVSQEQDGRDDVVRSYVTATRDARAYEERLLADVERRRQREQAVLQRLADVAAMRLVDLPSEEDESRRSIRVVEERCRAAISRLSEISLADVETGLRMQRLFRAENAKRYCSERHEVQEYQTILAAYMNTPWKPTLKVLGQCPFVRKVDCPFSEKIRVSAAAASVFSRRHVPSLSIHSSHYEHSVTSTLDSNQI